MNISTRFLCLIVLSCLGWSLSWGNPLVLRSTELDKITCLTLSQPQIVADTCAQGAGSITLNHDGTGPFTYTWAHDSSLNDSIATGLTSGQYAVTVMDANGCSDQRTYIVGSINPLTVPISTTPDTCGAPNGSAIIDINQIGGGVSPYTFEWDSAAGGGNAPSVTNLSAGSYTVRVTDSRGCARNVATTVASTDNNFDVDLFRDDVFCFGESTGRASALATGGNNGNYSFTWTLIGDTTVLGTDSVLANIPAGNYRVRVTDLDGGPTGGCFFNGLVNIGQPDTFLANFEMFPTVGCTTDDGLVVALPRGGVAPYQYLWSDGSTNDSLIGARADIYNLTITDDNGCTADAQIAVTSEPGPIFTTEVLQEDNCGLGEGIVRVNIERGTAPYQVIWFTSPGQFNDTSLFAYNLNQTAPGEQYRVTVIGADSCLQQADFAVPGNDPLTLQVTNKEDNYCDLRIGQATVEVTGGTLPYRYRWSTTPAITASTATGLKAGTYEIMVLDSFNCEISQEITIRDEEGFELSVDITDESCQGQADGSALAVIDGGRPPFTYEWDSNPIQRTRLASDLSGGLYNVTVIDADGCARQNFGEVASVTDVEADFSFAPDIDIPIVLSSAVVEFTNLSIGADSYLWTFGNGDSSVAANPTYVYQDTGSFFVKLKAFNNQGGCVDSVTYGPFVITSDGVVWVPNAFTPNGDDINDRFRVLGERVDQFDLRIYNRWGQLIFSSTSQDQGWDGSLPNGRQAPTGAYAYFLRTTVIGEKPLEYSGSLMLVR